MGFAELQVVYFLVSQVVDIQIGQVFIFAIGARRQDRQFNVQGFQVFFLVILVNFDHQRRVRLTGFPHGFTFQYHAFGLNRFDKIHESVCADHTDILFDVAGVHLAQAAPQGLFGQDVAFRGVGAQADNGGDVAHVPAFFEHQHRDNRFVRTLKTVDLIGLLTQQFQLFFGFAGLRLVDFAVAFGVDRQHGVFQVGVMAFQVFGHVVTVFGVVGHHKEDGFFAHLVMFGVGFAPFNHA